MFLGGHSAGASTAVAYAAWDFGGRPGYRDLDGLVLIDGGLLGSFASADLARAKRELADIRTGKVFLDLLGTGAPEINGIFAQVGALWAYKRPDEPSVLQQYPLLPDVRASRGFRVTNEALLGYAFDEDTSPDFLALIHLRAGRLADSGDPRGWQDGEITPIQRFTRAPTPRTIRTRPSGTTRAACCSTSTPRAPCARRPAAKYPRPAAMHGNEIDLPLYAFSTALTRRPRGARRQAARGALEDRGRPRSSTTAGPATSTRSRPRRPGTTS